jgi:hypothetical protein
LRSESPGKKLLAGKTVGVDSTTLEANAAMKSIVRRDTGEDWKQYVTRLMKEDGMNHSQLQADRRRGPPIRQRPQEQTGQQRGVSLEQRCREPHHPD